jgi:hypothetical protein
VRRLAEVFEQPEEDFVRRAGYLSPARPDDPPAGDIFDRAPLARLDAELRALPTVPEQMHQLDRLSEERRVRVIRRLARDFLWRLRQELEREEDDGAA